MKRTPQRRIFENYYKKHCAFQNGEYPHDYDYWEEYFDLLILDEYIKEGTLVVSVEEQKMLLLARNRICICCHSLSEIKDTMFRSIESDNAYV